MSDPTPAAVGTPEPEQTGTFVLAHSPDGLVVHQRVTTSSPDDPRRWLPLTGTPAELVTWQQLTTSSRLERLYRRGEQTEQIAGHEVTLDGHCLVCGVTHSTTEITRLREKEKDTQ